LNLDALMCAVLAKKMREVESRIASVNDPVKKLIYEYMLNELKRVQLEVCAHE